MRCILPIERLATTENFIIEWFSGGDDCGLYVFRSGYYQGPQFFVDLELVPGLIDKLRNGKETVTIFTRIVKGHMTHHLNRPKVQFVPRLHHIFKKDGGVWGEAYYTPMVVEAQELQELVDALESACSRDNIRRLEESNSSESYEVLNNKYLENGIWYILHLDGTSSRWPYNSDGVELKPAKLEKSPKIPFYPPSPKIILRKARDKHQCYKSVFKECIDYFWIKSGRHYVEHRHGGIIDRYHIKCAFRFGMIPIQWLNPHFEQYYRLIDLGWKGWIETERRKRTDYNEGELHIPSTFGVELHPSSDDPQSAPDYPTSTLEEFVEGFIQEVEAGYVLDRREKGKWREYLRDVPIDIEPYQTARNMVGLLNPKKGGGCDGNQT